ncbi:MAG: AAA family ATPase [Bacteroidales bacterium]|nr:AAA family ATPase [Bacteroidales bacterium]
MKFKNTGDLVNQVNTSLGEFCNEFGLKRKELAGLGKAPKRGILFTYDTVKENDWAINEGGGTELQYHIAFYGDDLEVRYGLGFNTQYVPFANKMSPVDYMQPYIYGFLKNEKKIKELLPDYGYVYGNIEQLKKPQNNQYTLFGKSVSVEKISDEYIIEDNIYNNIITDLKKQFQPYQIIFSDKNNFSKVAMNNQNIIDALMYKGQIVLQGPPGTGKTYTAKDIAEQILFSKVSEDKKQQKDLLESTAQFKLIQFHPAYSYEDFVRGIVAESKGDSIEYKTKNKILADFSKTAYTNFINSSKAPTVYSKEKWIETQFSLFVDDIEEKLESEEKIELTKKVSIFDTDTDAFRYKGQEGWVKNGNRMLFSDIIKAYFDENESRQDIKKNTNLSGLAHHHASYYIKVLDFFKDFLKYKNLVYTETQSHNEVLKSFVLIVDEINRANLPAVLGELIYALEYRGEKVESMYATIEEGNTLILPPNLYIIGTMNTSDRSVGHIDYAIRRRFAFIEILPKVLEGENFELELFKQVSALFIQNFDEYVLDNTVELKLSEHLSEEFRPEDVWLGHSYFIKGEGDFLLRKKYEIIPILKEYVKDGILKQSAESIINAL